MSKLQSGRKNWPTRFKTLGEMAKKFGKSSDAGKAFGILKVYLCQGVDIDLSLQRTDSKIGAWHKNLEIKPDPNTPAAEATSHRDFTTNSMLAIL